MKALIVSGPLFEDSELLVPYYRLLEEGIETQVASLARGAMHGKHGYKVEAVGLADINDQEYHLLLLPGGKAPITLRANSTLLELVGRFMTQGKTVAAICHGPLILVSAGVLAGRHLTGVRGIARDIERAGGHYLDERVVVDGNLITSRHPDDLPYFMREIIKRCRS